MCSFVIAVGFYYDFEINFTSRLIITESGHKNSVPISKSSDFQVESPVIFSVLKVVYLLDFPYGHRLVFDKNQL